MNPKKVLLISYNFLPNNNIGAIRPSKIAEGLLKDGYAVDVFTYGATSNDSVDCGAIPVKNKYLVNNSEIKKCEQSTEMENKVVKKKDMHFIASLKWHYRAYLSMKRDKVFLKKFKEVYKNELCLNNYDIVFSTFGPLCALQAGMFVKKQNPSIKWVCDFRDPVLVELAPLLFRPYYKHCQNSACKKADSIVTVSNGFMKRICKDKYSDKAFMIPNGYDLKDKEFFKPVSTDNIFKITYVGALYSGKRDFSPVFRALKELCDENKISPENISFEYAGAEFSVLSFQAQMFDMEKILHNNGKLSRGTCLQLQYSSQLLMLSTWNNKGEEGVFPGKFLEYMMIGRPIVAVVDGNLGNSEVAQVMAEGNFGVTYEAANEEKDYLVLKNYIKNQYDNFMQHGKTNFEPNQNVLDRYNYENIIKRIEALI